MNAKRASRKRMLRVRKVQHDIAVGAYIRSRAELAKVEDSQERVRSLRASMEISVGPTCGAALARHAEMASRLDHASVHLDQLCRKASEAHLVQDHQRIVAEQAHEGAKRLLGKADAEWEAQDRKRQSTFSRRRAAFALREDRP
jgi:hypothetical protein